MKELFQEDEAIKQELANEVDEEPENEASSFGISVSFCESIFILQAKPPKKKAEKKAKAKATKKKA